MTSMCIGIHITKKLQQEGCRGEENNNKVKTKKNMTGAGYHGGENIQTTTTKSMIHLCLEVEGLKSIKRVEINDFVNITTHILLRKGSIRLVTTACLDNMTIASRSQRIRRRSPITN